MIKYTAVLCLIILICGCGVGRKVPAQLTSHKQIYLLLGQSNMAGRGEITDEYKDLKHSRVLMLTKEMEWVLAKHPLHFDKPKAAGVGPGLSFGSSLAEAFPKDTIYLVPCAVGGTSITKWEPGAYDKVTRTHPYDDALLRIKVAMKMGAITGAIWLQGESDSSLPAAKTYLGKLSELIARLRKETNNANLPFVAGELGTYKANYKLINDELAKLPATVPFTALVSSQGFVHKGDSTHFDSPSATEYGRRFATGMMKLKK